MPEFWKHVAATWPAIKDAIETGVAYLGLPGFLFFGLWVREKIENRSIRKLLDASNAKLIETGEKSTGVLLGVAEDRLDLMSQIEALNAKIEKQAPKGRGR